MNLSRHRTERDRISRRFDCWNAVFPDLSRRSRHHVNRTRLSFQCESFPFRVRGSSKPQLAGRAQRQAEHPVEVRFVPVPSDPNADIVLGAENLANPRLGAIESLDVLDYRS